MPFYHMRLVTRPGRVCLPALVAFASLLLTAATLPAAPGRLNTSKRSDRVSTDQKAILPGENKTPERNEVLMDRRFRSGDEFKKESALVGERRSGITLEESRDKKLFPAPERKEYDVIERKDSPWAGKESRFSTSEDAYRSKVAVRFQDKIGDASPLGGGMTPVVSKRTTFDRVNRFAFRKNGDQAVTVTGAGSEREGRDISGSSAPAPGGSGGDRAPEPASLSSPPSAR
jgi:hypothetical protein